MFTTDFIFIFEQNQIKMKLYSELENLLKTEPNYITDDKELKKWVVINKAQNYDEELLSLLLENEEIKAKFFISIKDVLVFNQALFIQFLEQKNYLKDSYTSFKNKIGLTIDGKFLNQRNEIALVWPYKDCILEGGQSREEDKRKEIFFNEVLAQDEINQLLEPKVLSNAKRYSVDGEMKLDTFNRNSEGTITDNLIIKGNNLIALHSLKEEFVGKVKLIYIDPPYNTGNDGFKYNDSFNHSTWLTFMRNRLKVAKELLRDDGVIFIQCDDNEHEYLKIILNDIFGTQNFINHVTVKTKSSAGFKIVNEGLMEISEYIYIYSKAKMKNVIRNTYIKGKYDLNYKYVVTNPQDSYDKWIISDINSEAKKQIKTLKEVFGGKIPKSIEYDLKSNWALKNKEKVFRFTLINSDAGKETSEVKNHSLNNPNTVFIAKSGKGEIRYVLNGQQMFFYDKKVRDIDGELQPSELLSNIWNDIAWEGIAKEGNVTLNKGKKPEKLLRRIIEMSTNINDIVLDYHLGSGTTVAVAHKMNRQYIGIEQLDYGENDSVVRLQNVINCDTSGISKSLNWQGGGEFVYLELKKHNQNFIDQIETAKDTKAILKIWEEMKVKSFLNYNVDIKKQDEHIEEFKKLTLEEQKLHLVSILDKNQLYVNQSSLNDKDCNLTEEEVKITKDFYQL